MTSEHVLAFAIYDSSGDDTVRCDAWLEGYEAGEAVWTPDLGDSAISLVVGGQERLLDGWNFGRLELVVRQAEAALERLSNEQVAVVRSGVLDESTVPYLLVEPNGEQALVSIVFLPEPQAGWFPLSDYGPGTPEELYEWLAEHRADVLTASREDSDLLLAEVPLAPLLSDLDAQTAIARRVIALI